MRILTLISAIVLATASSFSQAATSATAQRPAAVLFYANYCLNCKLLDPRLDALKADYADRIDFLVIDYTAEAGRGPAEALARARGFHPLYAANRATGWVALLRPDGSQAGKLSASMDDAQLRAALDAFLTP